MSTQRRRDGWDLCSTILSAQRDRARALEQLKESDELLEGAQVELVALMETNGIERVEHNGSVLSIGRDAAGNACAINVMDKRSTRSSCGLKWPEQPTEPPPLEPADDVDPTEADAIGMIPAGGDAIMRAMAVTFDAADRLLNHEPPGGTAEIDDPVPVARAS